MAEYQILTITELSEKLRVSKRTVYHFAQKGKVPGAFKFGRHWRFRKDMIEQWIEEQTNPQLRNLA